MRINRTSRYGLYTFQLSRCCHIECLNQIVQNENGHDNGHEDWCLYANDYKHGECLQFKRRKNELKFHFEQRATSLLTLNIIIIQSRMICGRILSTTSTSRENRFTIRPSGVVSKNAIGSRIVWFSRLSCRFLAARTHPTAIAIDVANNVSASDSKHFFEKLVSFFWLIENYIELLPRLRTLLNRDHVLLERWSYHGRPSLTTKYSNKWKMLDLRLYQLT